ncbi:MAG: anti-sigma factor family protein, partial [Planctomycetaceae bacterium]
GELSPTDREQAERWLDEDAAAREQLQRLEEVGPLLQSLPKRTLEDGFRAAVLHRCERETLLCDETRSTELRPSSPSETPERRSWGVLTGGVLATAAMLFLAIRVATTSSEHRVTTNGPPRVADDSLNAPENRDAVVFDAERKNGEGGIAAETLRSRPSAQAVRKGRGNVETAKRGRFNKSDGSISPPGVSRAPLGAGFGGGRAAGTGGLKRNRAFSSAGGGFALDESLRGTLRLGDVLPYLAISGDRTAVVEVTVLDVRPAVDKLEVLLMENKVRSAWPTKKERETTSGSKVAQKFDLRRLKLGKDKRRGDDDGRGRLPAVYVEMTQSQLADVMRQVGRTTGSLRVALKPPVEFRDVPLAAPPPQLKNGLGKRLARKLTLADAVRFARDSVRGRAPARGDAVQTVHSGRKPAAPPTKGKRKSAKSALGNAAKVKRPQAEPNSDAESASRDGKSAAASVGRSFHLRLNLDERGNLFAPPRSAGTQSNGRVVQRGVRRRQFENQTAASRAAPVRVIFVFRERAASPAGKPKR